MRTMKIPVRKLSDYLIRQDQSEEISGTDLKQKYDVFEKRNNILHELRGCLCCIQPSFDEVSENGSVTAWGGVIGKALLLKDDMVHIGFDSIFLITFRQNKFTLYRHVYGGNKGDDIFSQGRPLTMDDYYNGFCIKSRGIYQRTIYRHVPNDIVKSFVDRCASECFPSEAVRLFNEIVDEKCNGYVRIDSVLKSGYRTKYDIISKGGKIKGLPKSLNRYNINSGLAIREAMNILSKDSMAKLYGKENSERLLEYISFYDSYPHGFDSLRRYLLAGLAGFLYSGIDQNVVLKYLSVCMENGMYPDTSISCEETMLKKLEPYMEIIPKDCLHVAEPYIRLEKALDYRYHLIRSREELRMEGTIQHNCVFTYEYDIDSGLCGIFTFTDNGYRYTIEVNYYNGRYSCPQFLGFANSCSEECSALKKRFVCELNAINASNLRNAS